MNIRGDNVYVCVYGVFITDNFVKTNYKMVNTKH